VKINVGVFLGGVSVEHEISVISAIQAIYAIDKERFNIIPIYITKNGFMVTGNNLLDIENYKNTEKLIASCDQITITRQGKDVFLFKIPPKRFSNNIVGKVDIAFPIVHGTNCEDGTIQGLFEILRLPYVGSDILASSLCMDKIMMKHVLKENDLPVLDCIAFYTKELKVNNEEIINHIESEIGYPIIVKPANLGSSIGIKKANNRQQLEKAISLAGEFSNRILVEKAIVRLKEINCAVLGDYETANASVCEEPINSDEILSYSDKYMSKNSSKGMSSSKRKLPADIAPEVELIIKNMAIRAFNSLCCNGVARIDFLIDLDMKNKIYVNEVNTIPGSLSFYLWEATGKSFTEFLSELIDLGFKRDRERKNLMYTYNSNIFSVSGSKG
jgi:D-alanine-D-alanine ligase